MIDESMDKEQLAQPPQPYEFRSKPTGQRLMIMVAGVIFNFLLALSIYSMVLFTWGDTYLPLKNITMGMEYSDTFKKVGFEDGDILYKADDIELERYNYASLRAVATARSVTIIRKGVEITILIPDDMMQRVLRDKKGIAAERFPMILKELESDNSPAALAGLQPGDSIVCIDEVETPAFGDVAEQLALKKNQEITVGFYRNKVAQSVQLVTDSLGKMGVFIKLPNEIYPTVTNTYGFFTSIPAGITLGVNTLKGYIGDMKYVFTKEGASNLGGFGTIGSLFPSAWDWRTFWMQTAFLSIILAFMNILPIPALDGGHVLFLLYEVIARRKPSDKFLEYTQIAGMALLFGLMIYANGNDIFRFFFK
jgi:regulator of sigma E protease